MNNSSEVKDIRNILKSTSIIGGARIITLLIKVIRTKFVALFLGTYGVGLVGLYQSIIDMIRIITGLGINSSGVKEISSSSYTDLPQTALTLKVWSIVTGFLGMLIMCMFANLISHTTFGTGEYKINIIVLSICILFTTLSESQTALLQGLRKISFMAQSSILGALLGLIIVVPIYAIWKTDGILYAMIISSIISLLVSNFYVRKINIPKIKLNIMNCFTTGYGLIKLGVFMSLSSLLTSITFYILKSHISSCLSINAVGIFQAAWTITNSYVLILLNSIATDFYPALSSVSHDNNKMNVMINQQTQLSVIIGTPMLILMIVFMPIIMRLLYTTSFTNSVPLASLFILGTFFKFVSWPICFVFPVKDRGVIILFTEVLWNVTILIITFLLWSRYELLAVGIAYIIAYVVYTLIALIINKRLCFKFSLKTSRIVIFSLISILFVYVIINVNIINFKYIIVAISTIFILMVYLKIFLKLVDGNELFIKFKNRIKSRKNE